jgi:hypothetical protein
VLGCTECHGSVCGGSEQGDNDRVGYLSVRMTVDGRNQCPETLRVDLGSPGDQRAGKLIRRRNSGRSSHRSYQRIGLLVHTWPIAYQSPIRVSEVDGAPSQLALINRAQLSGK